MSKKEAAAPSSWFSRLRFSGALGEEDEPIEGARDGFATSDRDRGGKAEKQSEAPETKGLRVIKRPKNQRLPFSLNFLCLFLFYFSFRNSWVKLQRSDTRLSRI